MMRFLISRMSALGDVVCSLPAAGALKRSYPTSEITWAVDPRFSGVVKCCEFVDVVVEQKSSKWGKLAPELAGPFDAAFDLQGLWKSGMIVGRARASKKLGYHWQREGSWLFSHRVLPDPTSFHIVDQYVDVVRAYGATADRAEFGLRPSDQADEKIRELLSESNVNGEFVVINAGAGWITKRWPGAAFAQLIGHLQNAGLRAVLIGGKAATDREAANEVIQQCSEPVVDLLGQTNIEGLIALISMSKFHIGGDTGSTHIAAALGIPAIGLYSITRPQRSCPYGQIDRCLYDPAGLAHISVEQVVSKLKQEGLLL